MEFKCPYCNRQERLSGSKFKSWVSVSQHMPRCKLKPKIIDYVCDKNVGPIHVSYFSGKYSSPKLLKLLGNTANKLSDIRKEFVRKGHLLPNGSQEWFKHELLEELQLFVKINNKIPSLRDFQYHRPDATTFQNHFGSWNKAIEAAGLIADYNDGFGTRTIAKDNILYRSKAEAYFVDNYLYGKFKYEYEKPYGNGWKYDFYLPEKDLYIEIDGELRPERIKEKIDFNRSMNRNFRIIKTSEIYTNFSL